MKKTDNKKLIIFAFFLKKLITDDFYKNVYPNKKKKTYALSPKHVENPFNILDQNI